MQSIVLGSDAPMTTAQHAEVMRKRIQHRRMVEEAKEMKKADSWHFDKR